MVKIIEVGDKNGNVAGKVFPGVETARKFIRSHLPFTKLELAIVPCDSQGNFYFCNRYGSKGYIWQSNV